MRLRVWVFLLLCLFAVSLLFSQLSSASADLRVNEAATKFLFDDGKTGASLVVENPAGRSVAANVRVELIDPQGVVRSSAERGELIREGTTTLFIRLPFQPAKLKDEERNQLLWYRLRYHIEPKDASSAAEKPVEGIISLSEITPDMFEVHVVGSAYAREGALYRARVRTAHPLDGHGIEGVRVEAQVKIEDEDKKLPTILSATGVTGAEGYATLNFNLPVGIKTDRADIKVIARRGLQVQEADDSIQFNQLSRIFISTDKPLYQPGQTLHARALIFSPLMQAIANEVMPFKIEDPEGTIVFRAELKTSRFGTASIDWPVPENTRLGLYTIAFGREDESYAFYRIRISRYDLPNFTTSIKLDHSFYLPGQNAEVEVRADYLFGQPVKRGRVRVVRETEREWNYREQKWETKEGDKYEGETDAQGRFIAHVNLQAEHEDLKDSDYQRFKDVTYAAYFTDISTGRTEQRRFDLRVTKEAIHVYVVGETYEQSSRLPLAFYVSTFYADGTPARCEVLISKGTSDDTGSEISKTGGGRRVATFTTNVYGLAKLSIPKPPVSETDADKVYLRFSAHDALGKVGHRNEDFNYKDNPAIRVQTDKTLYRRNDPVVVNIISSEKNLAVILDVSRDFQVLRSEFVHLQDGHASVTFPYDDQFRDELIVTAYTNTGVRDEIADSHSLLYPRDKDLRLDVRPEQTTYRPGQEAHVNFNVLAPDGRALESALGVVVFDKAVEERARGDQEFGSGFNLYGNYGGLLGWDERVAGVSRKDLEHLDLSKPLPEGLELLAEVLLNRNGHYVLNTFSGHNYELALPEIFAPLVNAQLKSVRDTLNARYLSRMEYPADEAGLRRILSESGINFDRLLDPWGMPYHSLFYVESQSDVLKILSAGADKRFRTADDFSVAVFSWRYFRPIGEAIDRAVQKYHERAGGYIRDEAALQSELLREGVDFGRLRDRWGEPYRIQFDVLNVHYVLKVVSGGPDKRFNRPDMQGDDFIIWSSMIDYFAERRAEIDAALNSQLKETRSFPQSMKELREALHRSKIDLGGLHDAWGREYYATFKTQSRFTDRVTIETRSQYGEKAQTHTAIKPVTQKVGIVTFRSAGADGKQGTADDFNVATFSLILSEQGRDDSKPEPAHTQAILTGKGGAITGTVTDTTGAVVPNATVRATLSSTEQFYEATTDDEGRFVLRDLPPGMYEVRTTAGGFSNSVVTSVLVSNSNIVTLDISLQPGAAMAAVEVTASNGATIETADFSLTASRQITELPLNGKNVSNVVGLQRGAVNVITKSGVSQDSTPRLREYFPETLLWQPLLETDAQGRAELRFKLADNITTWKLAVIGSTTSGEIGMAEKEILAFQPFFVEHDPPRVLTEGDTIQLPVVLRNYLAKSQVVELEIKPESWFTLLGPAQKRAEVAAGDNSRQTFDFRAVASVKDGKQRITATGADVSDQIERPVSVHPDGEEIAKTWSGILADSATLDADIPADAINGTPRAELKIYPNLMAHVVESIEGIMRRPYGCAEQTISAAYPSLLALRAYKRIGKEPPAVAAKARRYVQAGYERLLNYRASSGGFSYWGRGDADFALTAYALRFLHDSQDFVEVDGSVVEEAREWLVKQQRADGSWPAARGWWEKTEDQRRTAMLTAYIARVLAMTNDRDADVKTTNEKTTQPATSAPSVTSAPPPTSAPTKRALLYLSQRYLESDEPYLIASYALAASDAGDVKGAKDAIEKLRALAHEEAGASYWTLETNTPFYGWGLAGRIETTALVLQAMEKYCAAQNADCGLSNAGSSNPQSQIRIPQLIERGLLFLLRTKDRYGVWYSTQATVNTLDTLVALLSKNSPAAPDANGAVAPRRANAGGQEAQVFINGSPATTIELPPGDQLATPVIVDISRFISPGKTRVEIRRAAGSSAPASVQLVSTYYMPWAARKVASHANPDDSAKALRLNVSYDRSAAGIGSEITCRVEAERVGFRGYGMLLAEIGLPPGADVDRASLELAMKDSGWSLSQYDVLPDRLIVYLWPQAGGSSFTFKFRPRFGLAAESAPSLLYDYYNPEARVVVAPTKFVIKSR